LGSWSFYRFCYKSFFLFGACGALRRRTLPGSAIRLGAAHQPPMRLPSRLLGRVVFWLALTQGDHKGRPYYDVFVFLMAHTTFANHINHENHTNHGSYKMPFYGLGLR
jgi:hypothetical protein